MIRTLIIPGYRGSEPGHWQRHWALDNPSSEVVEQQDFIRPDLADWLHRLEAYLAAAPGAVLVAHSLGCALVAHLASRPSAAHVGGALLVAPADVDVLSNDITDFATFAALPRGELPFPSILVASRDDPFMRYARAEAFAAAWGAGLVDLGKAGHINVASGFGPWPEGVILAEALRARKAANVERGPRGETVTLRQPSIGAAFAGAARAELRVSCG
ncbi:MAG: alpha/beta hydrolase [Rhizobiaceae bacterium]|nr:alpha/beta hydrolase [Rhizobiaceae bacterium]